MSTNKLIALREAGQSPWIDFIRRASLQNGDFQKLIASGEIRGATSNPAIFEKAIDGSNDYDAQIKSLALSGVVDSKLVYDELTIADIQSAADQLRPVYDETDGLDGYISLEVSPESAYNTVATVTEAHYLWKRVERPNLMIKVPATPEGIPAIKQLISEGINVNVTLIFSLNAYEQAAFAYIEGLEIRKTKGLPTNRVRSVASFFISRVDSEVDGRLNALAAATDDAEKKANFTSLRGKAAVANAKLAYEKFTQLFSTARFQTLAAYGAHTQRCLWASTSTKNPAYSDVLYVDSLIGPDTVNTLPPATIDAFRDHGSVASTLTLDLDAAKAAIQALETAGVSMAEVTHKLLVDGVRLFVEPFAEMMQHLNAKIQFVRAEGSPQDSVTAGLNGIAGATVTAMDALDAAEAGAKLWNKNYTFWKTDPEIGKKIDNRLGWLNVIHDLKPHLAELDAFAQEVRSAGFTYVTLLGMGGSSLCPEVFRQTFGFRAGYPQLHVLDSTDPDAVFATERAIDVGKTIYVVASKSGGTLETMSHFHYFYEKVKALKGATAGENFVTVTDPGSPLSELAAQMHFRKIFLNPADIGGRYSALSYFGLVPAAIAGFDTAALLQSAEKMAAASAANVPARQNPGLKLGAIMSAGWKSGRDKMTIVASPPLASVGLWIEQLIAESTGKEGRGVLPVAQEPLGAPNVYSSDRVFVYIRSETGFDAQQDSDIAALEAAGHPVVRLSVPVTTDLGGLFLQWEIATAMTGHFLGINPFDEPNVQESKDNTNRILEVYKTTGKFQLPAELTSVDGIKIFSDGALKDFISSPSSMAQLREQLVKAVQPGDYIAIMAYIQPNEMHDKLLEKFRLALRNASRAATTVGYGPRFLHSTGQLHKGGANNGVFVQIICAEKQDASIPGQPYTFGALIHAQSLGDYQSLLNHGRRVVRLDLGASSAENLAKLS